MQELDYEYKRAMKDEDELNMKRRERVRSRIEANHKPEDELSHSLDVRKQHLLESNREEATRYQEVLARLRKTAADHIKSIRSETSEVMDDGAGANVMSGEML